MLSSRLLSFVRLTSASGSLAVGLSSLLVVSSVIAGVGFVGVLPASASTQPIDSCTTITEPGTYELTTDLETRQGIGDACIRIWANDVVFDGGGHAIRGNGTGTGIGVGDCCTEGPEDVVVRNVEVVHFSDGITAFEATHLRIRNARVVWADATGMSGGDGIYLFNGTDLVVEDSTVVNAEALAVQISGEDVVVRNNWLVSNDGGLNLYGEGHLVEGNLFENSGTLWAYGYGDHTVRNNTVENSTSTGIAVTDDSVVVNNVVRNNGNAGIEVGRNGVVAGNRIVGNEKGGILVDESGNLIYDNYFENERNVIGPEDEPPLGATWNVSRQSGTNVVGGSVLGGNYWAKPDGSGYSETCTDADGDGICDDPFSIPGTSTVDSLPLANSENDDSMETTTTTETTTTPTTTTTTTTITTTETTTATTTETTTSTSTTTTKTYHTQSNNSTTTTTETTTTMETTTEATTTEKTTTESSNSGGSSGGGASGQGASGTGSSAGGNGGGQSEAETTRTTTTVTTTPPTTAVTTKTTTQTVTTNETTQATTSTEAQTTEETTSESDSETSPATDSPSSGTTTDGGTAFDTSAALPGFELVVAVVALLAGAVLAMRQK